MKAINLSFFEKELGLGLFRGLLPANRVFLNGELEEFDNLPYAIVVSDMAIAVEDALCEINIEP